jgi:pimeloyl-ACP methyl ester carboxylesterase
MPTTAAFAHATGFCGGVWRPVVAALHGMETLVWDFPCHGSAPKLEHPIDWWDLGTWTLSQLSATLGPLIGVGHSMGGAALLMAEIKAPGTFAALLLIEPIVFPPPFERREGALSAQALKRKNHFESRVDARANFAGKLPFSAWNRMAFDGYIDCGLVETADGIELACRPADEAEIYRGATQHGVWDLLGNLDPPVTILAGANSDTHSLEVVQRLAKRIPRSEYQIIAGAGHFLPMEMPEVVVDSLARIEAGLQKESLGDDPG